MTTRPLRTAATLPLALALAAALAIAPMSVAAAAQQPDDGLAQIIDPNQAQGTGRVVLDDGHIDYGPTLNTGEWIIQIHDDTSVPRFWRMPSEVVAKVNDDSKLTVPNDEAYSFLGLEPGSAAWVIPQVRRPGVIWAGWNTQEPTVLDSLSLGATQRVLGVDGPGEVSVYLQAGNFGDPQSLWSTHDPFPQESWIEVNTHTHANWVFSEPGIYLVQIEFSGDLIDGTHVVAQDTLRFSVGDATDPETAFEMEFDTAQLEQHEADADKTPVATEGRGDLGLIVGIVVGTLVAALLIATVVILIAARRARTRARAEAWRRASERQEARRNGSEDDA